MTSIAEIMTTPEFKQAMNLQGQMDFDSMPESLIKFQDGDVCLVLDIDNKYDPYSIVTRETYPRIYGTINVESKNSFVVGICKRPENDNDSDWQHLGEFPVDQLNQALELLWANRENAINGW